MNLQWIVVVVTPTFTDTTLCESDKLVSFYVPDESVINVCSIASQTQLIRAVGW